MHVIEHPQRVQALLPGHTALLPVQPPEVDALVLKLVVQVEIRLHELRAGQVELDRFAAGRIDAHMLGGLGVAVLERADAVARVHVERGLEAMVAQRVQEALGIGEEVAVPGIAGPARAVLGVHVVDQMPVHVDDGRGERQPLMLEAIDQLQVLGLGVAVVAAPPVAHREPGQQRGRAGEAVEVLHGLDVAVAVAEHIQILPLIGARHHPGAERIGLALDGIGLDDHVRRGIIDHGPAIVRDDAEPQLGLAVHLVERARGAAQVAPLRFAVMPGVHLRVRDALDDDAQPLLAERLHVVGQAQRRGVDDEQAVAHGLRELRRGIPVAVHDHLRGMVLEYAVVLPFEADEGFGDHADAPAVALDDGPRIHAGVRVQLGELAHGSSFAWGCGHGWLLDGADGRPFSPPANGGAACG